MEVLRYENSNVVVKIQTTDIRSSWERFARRVDREEALTYCDYEASHEGELYLTDFNTFDAQPQLLSNARKWENQPPVFYETCKYGITIQFKTTLSKQPEIVHLLRSVTELFNAFEIGNSYILTGTLDLINEPGNFKLSYRYQPKGEAERIESLILPVVSPKLDIKHDLLHIMQDVNHEYNELVFHYLSKTFQNLQRHGASNNDVIWLSIFHNVIDEYLKAVSHIVHRPHLRVISKEYHDKAHRIKRWSPQMVTQFLFAEKRGLLQTTYFQHEEAENTVNTRENRFVKFTLERISRRLAAILEKFGQLPKQTKNELSGVEEEQLANYQFQLQKLSSNALFRRVGRFEGFKQESLVLQKRTGYAQVYHNWLILQSGLELLEGTNGIGVRPVWELYEVWCFLKLRQLVSDILGDEAEIEEDKRTMLQPFSDSNVEHIVTFHFRGDKIELVYQHTYNRHKDDDIHTATTEQRPDFVLNIHKANGFTLTYLFDAKYRVYDDTTETEKEDCSDLADYPPSDAINQMHRYRDAIYYGSSRYEHTAKEIIGGYILFPGRGDEKVRDRYFFKSIETVNIGAFPLLPDSRQPESEGKLLREHLERILLEPTPYELIKNAIPQRGLSYTPFNTDGVLIGFVPDKAHFEWIQQTSLYNIRQEAPRSHREGAVIPEMEYMLVKHIILYTLEEERVKWIGSYNMISDNAVPLTQSVSELDAHREIKYPRSPQSSIHDKYLVWEIDLQNQRAIEFDGSKVRKLIKENAIIGKPILTAYQAIK